MFKYSIIALSSVLLMSCATPKQFVPTNGSRADGTIELSYMHGKYEQPVVDPNDTYMQAKNRCKAWGYKDAEAFGAETSNCRSFNDCGTLVVTTRYQCLGNLK